MTFLDFAFSLWGYLFTGGVLFLLGLFTILRRGDLVGVLLGIELLLNASGLNFVAFSRWRGDLDGQIYALFLIFIAAAEAAVGLALVLHLHRLRQTIQVGDATSEREA